MYYSLKLLTNPPICKGFTKVVETMENRLSHQVTDLALIQAIDRYLGTGQNAKMFLRFGDVRACAKQNGLGSKSLNLT